jgi:HAD superfamily hydrolase (TIGR01484 family)
VPIQLIVCDIDGTLLNSVGFVSQRNVRALREADSWGAQIVLATGNCHPHALGVAEMLRMKAHIVSSNGSLIQLASGSVVRRRVLEAKFAREILAAMQHPDVRSTITFDRSNLPASDSPVAHPATAEILQLTFCGSSSNLQLALQRLTASGMAKTLAVSALAAAGQESVVDIGPADATKESALRFLCCALGIGEQNVAAIGNSENDSGMLEFAGQSFVVANAPEEMKKRNWRIVPSNDLDGVAWAIDSLRQPGTTRFPL